MSLIGGNNYAVQSWLYLYLIVHEISYFVRSAYRRLALQHHPDKVKARGGDVQAGEAKFKRCVNAYERIVNSSPGPAAAPARPASPSSRRPARSTLRRRCTPSSSRRSPRASPRSSSPSRSRSRATSSRATAPSRPPRLMAPSPSRWAIQRRLRLDQGAMPSPPRRKM